MRTPAALATPSSLPHPASLWVWLGAKAGWMTFGGSLCLLRLTFGDQ